MEKLKGSKLKGLTSLKENVKIYVPSTFNVNKEIDNRKYVDNISINLSKLFGGATETIGIGSYVSERGMLIKEQVNIVQSFTDKIGNEEIDKILSLCEWLKEEMKQECISLEINNQLYFI